MQHIEFYSGDQSAASLSNLRGGLVPTRNGILGVTQISFPPFFQGVANSGDESFASFPSNLTIDGNHTPVTHTQKWSPYEISRAGHVTLSTGMIVPVNTSVRLGYDSNTVLMKIIFNSNTPDNISMRLPAPIRWFEPTGWEWGHPSPTSFTDFHGAKIFPSLNKPTSIRSCDQSLIEPLVFLEDCDVTKSAQQWSGELFSQLGTASLLHNFGPAAQCLSNLTNGPMSMIDCNSDDKKQPAALFVFVNGTIRSSILNSQEEHMCLDAIHGFRHTDIGTYACHSPSNVDYLHQQFEYDAHTRQLKSLGVRGQCVAPMLTKPKRACVGISTFTSSVGERNMTCLTSVDLDGVGRLDCVAAEERQASSSSSSSSSESMSSLTLGLVLVVGEDNQEKSVESLASSLAGSFEDSFDKVLDDMESWWSTSFVPPTSSAATDVTTATTPATAPPRPGSHPALLFRPGKKGSLRLRHEHSAGKHALRHIVLDHPLTLTIDRP